MAYNIWISIEVRKILKSIKENEFEVYQQIQEMLKFLALERENFIIGAPFKNEAFLVGDWQIYYRVLHRIQGIDVTDIVKLP